MQRVLDVLLSSASLIVLSPLLLPIVVILRFTGEGEIFFLQQRVGKNGKQFNIYKFATMMKNSPNIGTGTVTVKNDPRVLPFGRLLRKTKINEIPQLINILLGDMSIIGPRPQTSRCFDAYPVELQKIIIQTRPGLSGVGSIIFRDEEEILAYQNNNLEFYDQVIASYKGQIEAWYIHNCTLYNYFALIFTTILVVLNPSSKLIWKIFPNLPRPPKPLVSSLRYPA